MWYFISESTPIEQKFELFNEYIFILSLNQSVSFLVAILKLSFLVYLFVCKMSQDTLKIVNIGNLRPFGKSTTSKVFPHAFLYSEFQSF